MNLARSTPHLLLSSVAIMLAPLTMTARGEVSFHLQRAGSPEDTGHAQFLASLGDYEEQDFEDPDLGELGDEVPSLSFNDDTVELELLAQWAELPPPTIGYSSEFDVPGQIYNRALVCGIGLTINSVGQRPLHGIGMWIFDDTGAFDAIYHIQVTESDGSTWEVVLENEVDQNIYRHEIEGFFGAQSDIGITSVTITPIDPETGESLPDLLEVDHLIVTGLDLIPDEKPTPCCRHQWCNRKHHRNSCNRNDCKHRHHRNCCGKHNRKHRPHKNSCGKHARKHRDHKKGVHHRSDRERHEQQGDVQREKPRRHRRDYYQRESYKRRW